MSPIWVALAGVSPATATFYRCAYALPALLVIWFVGRKRDSRSPRLRLMAFASGLILAADLDDLAPQHRAHRRGLVHGARKYPSGLRRSSRLALPPRAAGARGVSNDPCHPRRRHAHLGIGTRRRLRKSAGGGRDTRGDERSFFMRASFSPFARRTASWRRRRAHYSTRARAAPSRP